MGLNVFVENSGLKEEFIRFVSGQIKAHVNVLSFTDKDTKHIVILMPSLDISGYGNTNEEAQEMLRFSIDELFDHLSKLSTKKREGEMNKMGWKHTFLKNKDYSKAFVDITGELKNFNAEKDSVKVLTYEAA